MFQDKLFGGCTLIYLSRNRPHKLEVSEVLIRRAVYDDLQRQLLEDIILKSSIGYEGECFVDKYWSDLRLTFPHALLHGFETTHRQHFHHQIDTIMICPNYILLTELKYIAGELFYDESLNQLWRIHNGQHLALGDPFAQVSRHEMWLTHFLWEIGVDVPIITAVIVTAKSALLRQMPKQFHVFKLDGLGLKMKSWLQIYPKVLDEWQVEHIALELLKHHRAQRWNWKEVFTGLRLKKGVLCRCGSTMRYQKGKFLCTCGASTRKGIYEALNDYRITQSEWISNREFRNYLGISSADTAFKILKKVSSEEIGKNKGRKYRLSREILREKLGFTDKF